MSNPMKRKHEELDDSDDEEPYFGKQILPVANLPADFDGVPTDGMEYLFTVRRDARLLPQITRVPNPYEEPLPPPRLSSIPHPSIPSEEWRSVLGMRFKNLKQNLTQPTIHVDISSSSNRKLMPDKQERALWWEFLAGKPQTIWDPPKKLSKKKEKQLAKRGIRISESFKMEAEGGTTVQEYQVEDESVIVANVSNEVPAESPVLAIYRHVKPTPSLLKHIDEKTALHLLMYFTHWINLHLSSSSDSDPPFPRLRQTHAQWIFALLTRIEEHVSADDMSLLRNLARACISLLGTLIQEKAPEASETEPETETDPWIDVCSCWMIVSLIVGFWGQRDLWMDAEEILRKTRLET
ncbi:hypothetical protein K435DRAFT_958935 [Dendrothele bispora CBS 962.96]|uniref:Uncharacterized protein n=1 Tax=Dendrothele bispora (strain CBS 962.96) TaxID=1314807 RepID=A0A4V4HIX0_DENBC|nr:hypothetical protein K435DRAFT_958935 [Dendrothele bispora CBS 962.96]